MDARVNPSRRSTEQPVLKHDTRTEGKVLASARKESR